MLVRRSLLVLALALLTVRCADQPMAVNAVRAPATPQFHPWAGNVAPQFTATSSQHQHRGRSASMAPPLSLDSYQVSFWAVRGESRFVKINYQSTIDQGT